MVAAQAGFIQWIFDGKGGAKMINTLYDKEVNVNSFQSINEVVEEKIPEKKEPKNFKTRANLPTKEVQPIEVYVAPPEKKVVSTKITLVKTSKSSQSTPVEKKVIDENDLFLQQMAYSGN